MESTHLYALLPLMIFLVLSMIWYGRGLLHLLTGSYAVILAFIAITQGWEMLFFPVCLISVIIAIILFVISMSKGDWI